MLQLSFTTAFVPFSLLQNTYHEQAPFCLVCSADFRQRHAEDTNVSTYPECRPYQTKVLVCLLFNVHQQSLLAHSLASEGSTASVIASCICSGLLQVIMFFVCTIFLAIRGATGAVAIYIPYQQYWAEDRLYYPLDTLPEYLILIILSWPAFMARMAQSYPKALQDQGKKKKDKQKKKGENGVEFSSAARG